MQLTTQLLPGNKKLPTTKNRITIDGMEYVSIHEAAQISGYSEQYVRRLIRQGRVAATKKGPMYWIDLESLKAYKQEMDMLGSEKFNPHRETD
jgi:excisionase family DNA binding protein